MVGYMPPETERSAQDQINVIQNEKAGVENSALGGDESPGSTDSKFTGKEYPGPLAEVILSAVGGKTGLKVISVFAGLVSDGKEKGKKVVQDVTQRVNVMPKPGYMEIKAAAKNAQKKLSHSLKSKSKFFGITLAEQIKMTRLSVGRGPGVFQINGMKATAKMAPVIMRDLEKKMTQALRKLARPHETGWDANVIAQGVKVGDDKAERDLEIVKTKKVWKDSPLFRGHIFGKPGSPTPG